MTTYDEKTVTAMAAQQWDCTADAFTAIQVICRDARLDPTNEQVVLIPDTHGRTRVMYRNDWLFAAATGEFIVMPDTTFGTLFVASA